MQDWLQSTTTERSEATPGLENPMASPAGRTNSFFVEIARWQHPRAQLHYARPYAVEGNYQTTVRGVGIARRVGRGRILERKCASWRCRESRARLRYWPGQHGGPHWCSRRAD